MGGIGFLLRVVDFLDACIRTSDIVLLPLVLGSKSRATSSLSKVLRYTTAPAQVGRLIYCYDDDVSSHSKQAKWPSSAAV